MSTSSPHRPDQAAALRDEWVDARRQIAMLEARSASLLADRLALMDADVDEMPLHRNAIERSMVAEYTAAGRMAKGSVEHAFTDARLLREEFPAVRESFEAGSITATHAHDILKAASPIQRAIGAGALLPHLLGLYEAAALEFAEAESPARSRAHVRELAAVIAPLAVVERHKEALSEQYVSVKPLDDEMSLLTALLPTHRAEAVMDRLNSMARHQKQHPDDRRPTLPPDDADSDDARLVDVITADGTFTIDPFGCRNPEVFDMSETPEALDAYEDMVERMIAQGPVTIRIPTDERGIDQIRAELLTDLLLAADPSEACGDGLENITAHVQVTVAATTLIGADERPAQLDGAGTLPPDVARALAGKATSWTRLFVDDTGMVTHTDTYIPTAGMRRYLRARDQHCRFPGCRMPAHRCQIDHTFDHALGGETSLDNLAHLCLTHHALKHPDIPGSHRWAARQLPDWSLEWTAPDGHVYADHPPRRVMFVPSGPPVPADDVAPF